jgi:hypothetical protein
MLGQIRPSPRKGKTREFSLGLLAGCPFHYRQFAWPSLHGLTSVCGLAVAPSDLAIGELFPFLVYKRKIPATVSVAGIFVLFNSALNRFDIKVEKCGG